MQVNAINSMKNVYFGQKGNVKNEKNAPENNQPSGRFMHKLTGPVAAALFLVPVAAGTLNTGCTKISAEANATAYVAVSPGGTDTIYVPINPDPVFPQDVEDSLNFWRGRILDIDADGDTVNPDDYKNKIVLAAGGERDWEFRRPETLVLNFNRTTDNEAVYTHTILPGETHPERVDNEIRISKVLPGEITIVKRDGTQLNNVSGLMFNEDGKKTFMHSNGSDKIFVYPKATSGENVGKYVELGTVEPGYLNPEDGIPSYNQNVLLQDILSPGSEDHYVDVNATVKTVDEINEELKKAAAKRF